MDAITNYKKVLFQKNKLLAAIKSRPRARAEDLSVWNEQLAALGSFIILERKKFINFLNTSIADVYTTISGFHRPVEVFYDTLAGDTLEAIAESFRQKLAVAAKKEAILGTSLVGPHRDDFSLQSDGLYLSPFSSRGELRSQVLALKILELGVFKQGRGKADFAFG